MARGSRGCIPVVFQSKSGSGFEDLAADIQRDITVFTQMGHAVIFKLLHQIVDAFSPMP